MRLHRIHVIVIALLAGAASSAGAHPPRKEPTMADIERLEKRIEEHQRTIDRLVKLQHLLQQVFGDDVASAAVPPPIVDKQPPPSAEKPVEKPKAIEAAVKKPAVIERRPAPPPVKKDEPRRPGTVVGKVTGVADAIVYIEDIVQPVRGAAAMKQEGKQFVPQVLIVTKGTTVSFPNNDAIFHNVFSPSPEQTFDLGSYKQGETRSVTMNQPGVVTVYCNMHPQMVGHILVVPNGKYVRAGKDGFFRLTDVPPGSHRVVAWAPNAKPTVVQTNVVADQVATIEMTLARRHTAQHVKKDGLPYGSYEK